MITLPGQLAIRTINGRNGDFNVGRLSTSIGEFVIKDALLEQHTEGKYRGDFAINEIRASYYTSGGRLVIEIRALLNSMTLDDVNALTPADSAGIDSQVPDPIDEEKTSTEAKTPTRNKRQGSPPASEDNAPFGMPAISKLESPSALNDTDQELFGSIWPLNDVVRLDSTVDRQQLRSQCKRLAELGFELDFRSQTWKRLAHTDNA